MKTLKLAGLGLLMATLSTSASFAEDSNVLFTGLIPDTCEVTVLTPGLLAAAESQTKLTSEVTAGGTSATATVVTNSAGSTISVIPPIQFDVAPDGSSAASTFSSGYALTGTTVATQADGTQATPLNFGLAAMTVDAAATRTDGNAFQGGSYEMTAIIRCVQE